MIKGISALLFALLFWLIILFLFFSGLYVHHIKANGIDLFFNRFFIENQSPIVWGVVLLGTIFFTLLPIRFGQKVVWYLLCLSLSAVSWIPSLSQSIAEVLFVKKHLTYRFGSKEVHDVTLLYTSQGVDYVKIPTRQETILYPRHFRQEDPI